MLTLQTLGTLAGAVTAVTAVLEVGRRLSANFVSPLSTLLVAQAVVITDGLATESLSFGNVTLWIINGILVAAAASGIRKGVTSWIQGLR